MKRAGIDVVMVREPGGTPVAEALRDELLNADRAWSPAMELLYLVTARADLVTRVIRPALTRGSVVISDRYDLSTMAYQGAGRGLPLDQVRWVNGAATDGLTPDLTLVLDVDPATARDRQQRAGKGLDRMEREPAEFHRRVAAVYRDASGTGVHHLQADVAEETLLNQAWARLVECDPDRFAQAIPVPES